MISGKKTKRGGDDNHDPDGGCVMTIREHLNSTFFDRFDFMKPFVPKEPTFYADDDCFPLSTVKSLTLDELATDQLVAFLVPVCSAIIVALCIYFGIPFFKLPPL